MPGRADTIAGAAAAAAAPPALYTNIHTRVEMYTKLQEHSSENRHTLLPTSLSFRTQYILPFHTHVIDLVGLCSQAAELGLKLKLSVDA